MADILRDFQIAFRVLRRNSGTTIVAVLALALGIGANAGIFTGVHSMILHPFPYPNLERIMTLWETVPALQTNRDAAAPANFMDWRELALSFETLEAYRPWSVNLTSGMLLPLLEVLFRA